MNFQNKVVLVTGAGSGLGEEIAIGFAKLSANLSIADVNSESLKNTATKCEKYNVKVLQAVIDVTKEEDVKKMIENTIKHFGSLDVVVNCAGILRFENIFSDNFLTNLNAVLDVNLKAVAAVCHFAAPALIESKGCIVNISSIVSVSVAENSLSYTVSKAALNHFSRGIAISLGPKGVRVNCVLPGGVKTNIYTSAGMSCENVDALLDKVQDTSPLKRCVEASDVADLVSFLASDKASCITGTCIPVDCGYLLKHKSSEIDNCLHKACHVNHSDRM